MFKHKIDPEVQAQFDKFNEDISNLRELFETIRTSLVELTADFKILDTETNAIEPRINERFNQIEKSISEGSLSSENSHPVSTGVRVFTQRRHDRQVASSAVNEMAGRIAKVSAVLPNMKEN